MNPSEAKPFHFDHVNQVVRGPDAKIGDPCAKCGERPSTMVWADDGGALAYSHGFYTFWCDVCALTAQLEHAKERAALIPELERKLEEARSA